METFLYHYEKFPLSQELIFEELKSSLNKIISQEVSKYSTKMTEKNDFCKQKVWRWKSHTAEMRTKLKENQKLIDKLQTDNESLQNRLESSSNEMESQRKQMLEQQNELENKSKRIQKLEKTNLENGSLIDKQKKHNKEN